jgi:hypothetical protein
MTTDDQQHEQTPQGCPECDWGGEVAVTHDYDHVYHTHVIVRDGEVFRGSTCSRRTRPKKKGIMARVFG